MNNIKKMYMRLTEGLVRSRTLPFLLSVQNIAFAILVLIFVNVIISKGKSSGELDYIQIKLFYNLVMYLLFTFIFIYAPYFLGGSLNGLVKNNTIEYLLVSKLTIKEIAFATFLRGLSNILILVISTFPIACVSFYFGGVGIARILRIIICLIAFSILLSSLSLYISSCYSEKNVTILTSYIFCFVLFIVNTLFLKYIVNINIITFFYFVILVAISFVLMNLSFKGKVFEF